MSNHINQTLEKLFKSFKGGDSSALFQILEQQRPLLYDYILRMTGQITKAVDTTDEVFESLVDARGEDYLELADLRSCIYATARRFNADTWNADTSKLMNAALEMDPLEGAEKNHQLECEPTEKEVEKQAEQLRSFTALDQALRSLPGLEREVVLLRSIHGFDAEGAATVLVCSEIESETLYLTAMQHIDAECSGIVQQPESTLLQLPLHPMPQPVTQATVNLSVMMNDIKSKPGGMFTLRRFLLGCLVVIGLAGVGLYIWGGPEAMAQLIEVLSP